MAKVVVVIPTYNEREQTPRMIEALAGLFKNIKKHDMHLLYADDTSPDKTYEVVREYMKKYDWLHLTMNKEKAGIGGAYAKAFKYAMKELNADYILEFDSDFQHRVEDIPKFLEKIDEKYDLVIGSRYIPGGSIPEEWGLKRKFFSVVGNWICRIGFLMPGIHDFTTGFKLTRVKGNLDSYNLDGFYSNSFAYKIQMTAEMANAGKKIAEVPIQFMSRKTGESKLIKNELGDFLRVIFLFQLHNPKMRKFIKFGTVGFIGYLVNAIVLQVMTVLNAPGWLAWSVPVELSIISNFLLNNIWTFKEDKITGVGKMLYKFLQFNLTSAGALIIQTVAGLAIDYFFGIGASPVFGISYRQLSLPFIIVFLVLPYNYFMYNVVIWRSWDLRKKRKK